MDQKDLSSLLFESGALEVAPQDRPFWYTSGSFGPYYLNTHFLYGGPQKADEFLTEIERARNLKEEMPRRLYQSIERSLQEDKAFRDLIQMLCEEVIALDFDIISGGERRDFFFSIPLAAKLALPHLSILKDRTTYYSDARFQRSKTLNEGDLEGAKVLHVADLLTQGSSYLRAWLPAIHHVGGKITDTAVIVSRLQGGEEALKEEGVTTHCLLDLTADFFADAVTSGHLKEGERIQILRFSENPKNYMQSFLDEHPNFLERSAAESARLSERVARFKKEFPDLVK